MSFLFGCRHKKTTFPFTPRDASRRGEASRTYQVCLDCGREIPYDWAEMKVVKRRTAQASETEREYQSAIPA